VLLLVELVHQVARAAAGNANARTVADPVGECERVLRLWTRGCVRPDEVVDREPGVPTEVAVERDAPRSRPVAHLCEWRHCQVDVELEQARILRAALIDLGRVSGVRVRETIYALPAA